MKQQRTVFTYLKENRLKTYGNLKKLAEEEGLAVDTLYKHFSRNKSSFVHLKEGAKIYKTIIES